MSSTVYNYKRVHKEKSLYKIIIWGFMEWLVAVVALYVVQFEVKCLMAYFILQSI